MRRQALTLLLPILLLVPIVGPSASSGNAVYGGVVDGSSYIVEMPPAWNGTLLLFSHGYVGWGNANPATVAPDSATANALLRRGYALAGGAYSEQGWAVEQALPEQIDLLSLVAARWHPRHILLWGESMGGLITTLLAQDSASGAAGALALCGVVGGSSLLWARWLTGAIAFQRLVAGGDPRLRTVDITNPGAQLKLARSYLQQAQMTPAGRARVALAAALAGVPGWFTGDRPATAAAMERAQANWLNSLVLFFEFDARAELEGRAGGNPSSTLGIDDTTVLATSSSAREVTALYRRAHLSLAGDLATLAGVAPIRADPGAARYVDEYGRPAGDLHVPVLTVQTIGDGLISPSDDRAYAERVAAAGGLSRLRQLYVERAGHCTFTPGELVTAIGVLNSRVSSGSWPALDAHTLNDTAAAVGVPARRQPPAFTSYQPPASAFLP
ncbi:MAG: alpha/beta hydrolase [Candidatus Dormibacteraeota bacterium]|nr:alpha/beta hydrolase [Candidatus Dormibacteraeota bacterium]